MPKPGYWKWFTRGFLLTLLVFGLVLFPRFAQTQSGGNAEEQGLIDDGNSSQTTDDPLGRRFIPLEETSDPRSNLQFMEIKDSASSGATDDPQGRLSVPLNEDPSVESNIAIAGEASSNAVALSSEAASEREAALLSVGAAYTSPLVIPAADFTADGSNPDSLFFPFGGGYYQGDEENYGCMVAPAYLPAGANVEDMFATVYDNDTSFNIAIDLRRVDNFAGSTTSMGSAASTGDFAGIQTINDATINEPLVVYPDYSYYITTCVLSGSLRLYSVRLYYSIP